MVKKLLVLVTLGVLLSGCLMAPLALVGPISTGFSTASLVQTSITTATNYVVKQGTGKSIGEHALDAINIDILKQSYFPENNVATLIAPKPKPIN